MNARAPMLAGSPRERLRTIALFIGALLFLFEEWLWLSFTRFFDWLGRHRAVRWLETRLAGVPPLAALGILCVPMLLIFPVKIAGLWMIATGHFLTGCATMIAAKLLSTAIVARIFVTCRPQLLRMAWFDRLYEWTLVLSARVHSWLDRQPAWRAAKRSMRRARSHVWAWIHGISLTRAEEAGPMRRGLLLRWRKQRKAQRRREAASTAAQDPRA